MYLNPFKNKLVVEWKAHSKMIKLLKERVVYYSLGTFYKE